ncbi:hypothetical protein K2Q08_02190 [Patescibacteria group bacterium]|nr:hypothetical protein [Patescibacteria group bacterium]
MNMIRSVLQGSVAAAVCVFLLVGPAPSAKADALREITIINDTRTDMERFYATRSSRRSWGSDRFGSNVLWGGQRFRLDLSDGSDACVFDFKAVFADGEEVVRYGLDVCRTDSWRVFSGRRR